jgi:hypothetical protein
MAGALTPTNLGSRAELLVDKHADYIRGFAEVRREGSRAAGV